jgi:DNA-directed RNA polymerase specialized sigma24 family protein
MERLKGVLEVGRVQTVEELVRAANRNVRWVLGDLARGLRNREASGGDVPEREDTADGDEALPLEVWEDLHHQAAFLPGRPGEVFRLRYYDRLSVPGIAEELGVSVRTVQNAWQEALEQLSLKLTGRPFRGGAPKHLGGERDDGGDGP